ncbi:MAG: bifunctional 2-polyprenyl-6-hydroxyphenol methylase/3-demethylubiquinol 3-O-methyltransferase UbiG, partial [Pseudomonadota bacterium]
MYESPPNSDAAEIQKFDAMAAGWWDPDGDFKPLHELNPLRLSFVQKETKLDGARVLDVGCGGGILAEAMARCGAIVTGVDLAADALAVARAHAADQAVDVNYVCEPIAEHASANLDNYDAVTCMELLEHVPDPAQLVADCARALRPGGTVFFSTINRTPRAYALAVVGAEYVLRLLPRGTH